MKADQVFEASFFTFFGVSLLYVGCLTAVGCFQNWSSAVENGLIFVILPVTCLCFPFAAFLFMLAIGALMEGSSS